MRRPRDDSVQVAAKVGSQCDSRTGVVIDVQFDGAAARLTDQSIRVILPDVQIHRRAAAAGGAKKLVSPIKAATAAMRQKAVPGSPDIGC